MILTGGDPLVLSPRRLAQIVDALAAIEHVKIIRVHTRVPVVAPGRITPALVRSLKARGKATYVVLHANHARELTAEARAACARLVDAGIPMLSQTVLLRGVNDDAAVLGELMRALVECRIKPYYLHHGDLAPGTAHWRTGIEEGQALMRALHGRLSGLCQPAYVLDIPGGHGKSPIGPSYLTRVGGSQRHGALRRRGLQRAPPRLSARRAECQERVPFMWLGRLLRRALDFSAWTHFLRKTGRPLSGKCSTSSPTAAAAPHLASAAPIEVVEDCVVATCVPIPRQQFDPFARGPAPAGRRPADEARAVDDEVGAVGRPHDLDHMPLRRQIKRVVTVARARNIHSVGENRCAHQHDQRERRHRLKHFRLSTDGHGR